MNSNQSYYEPIHELVLAIVYSPVQQQQARSLRAPLHSPMTKLGKLVAFKNGLWELRV